MNETQSRKPPAGAEATALLWVPSLASRMAGVDSPSRGARLEELITGDQVRRIRPALLLGLVPLLLVLPVIITNRTEHSFDARPLAKIFYAFQLIFRTTSGVGMV